MRLFQYAISLAAWCSMNALANADPLQDAHLRSTRGGTTRDLTKGVAPTPAPVNGGEEVADDTYWQDVPTTSPAPVAVMSPVREPDVLCSQSRTCPAGQGVMHLKRGGRCIVPRKCVAADEQSLLSASGWKCGVCTP